MIDHADNVPEGTVLHADVCIVGAGPAGITMALALQDSGLDVLLLEGGQEAADPASQDLYAGEVTDAALHSPPVHYRHRCLGGATTTWGGRCVPFDPLDFEPRSGVPHSGWPLSYDDVARYYPAANALCEAGRFEYRAELALDPLTPPMFAGPLDPRMTSEGMERFSYPTDFGRRYKLRLAGAAGVRLLLGANCTDIMLGVDGNHVEQLQIATLGGRRFRVAARQVVLAVGGLETPRLLLASNSVQRSGVGNQNDVVGRYYMGHLAGSVGSLELKGPAAQVRHGYEVAPEGVYCRRRLALVPAEQARLGVANMVARMHFPALADPVHGSSVLSGIYILRGFLSYEYSRRLGNADEGGWRTGFGHLLNILRYPQDAVTFGIHWLVHRKLTARKFPSVILKNRGNRFSLEINAEQAPLPESRVTLADSRDALGMPRLRVDWRYSPGDIASVRTSLQAFSESFAASGLGSYQFDADRLEHDLTCYGVYGGHHIGTARMGHDPKTSVVDADCRVHGVDNLFVAGSAVFPTSSQANPTLTLVALSLRLADHLRRQLSATEAP